MYLSNLRLKNFRNYKELNVEFPTGLIIFSGENAQGKSNILEAMYCLAITKSPRAQNDREMINFEALKDGMFSEIEATVERQDGPMTLRITLSGNLLQPNHDDSNISRTKKHIRINGIPHLASKAIGKVNAVLFSPDDIEVIMGSPASRRRYLDILLSQLSNEYLQSLQAYHRILSQRNHLLRSIKENRSSPEELDFWDRELCKTGAFILEERATGVNFLAKESAKTYSNLAYDDESLTIEYSPNIKASSHSKEEYRNIFADNLLEYRTRDIKAGMTLSGPHRDDLNICINKHAVSIAASRGQARTAALALKLSEAKFLAKYRQEEPILLLDDALSELDSSRKLFLLREISKKKQVFLTTVDVEKTGEGIPIAASYTIKNGGLI